MIFSVLTINLGAPYDSSSSINLSSDTILCSQARIHDYFLPIWVKIAQESVDLEVPHKCVFFTLRDLYSQTENPMIG